MISIHYVGPIGLRELVTSLCNSNTRLNLIIYSKLSSNLPVVRLTDLCLRSFQNKLGNQVLLYPVNF